jgi:hypothetical protein
MKKIFSVAIAALFLVGSAAIAVAQEATPTPEAKQRERAAKIREGRPGGKVRRDFVLLHTDGVGMKADGTTVEIRTQKGIITAVSATSITLKSPGNYVQTYKIDADTKVREKRQPSTVGDLKTGEMANIHAVKSGEDYVAKLINCTGEPGPRLKALLEKP